MMISKTKATLLAAGILAIATFATSCSSSVETDWREVTIEEALPVASHIYDSLFGDSPNEAVSAIYNGPRSFTIYYPYWNDCLIEFYSDEGEDEDYYYQCIYETFDGVEVMTQQRWFYGNEDSYNAGYVLRNEDGSVKEKGEWDYETALNHEVGNVCGDRMWNNYYTSVEALISCGAEAPYPYFLTFKRFFIKGDDDLILVCHFSWAGIDCDYVYVYKDCLITYCDTDVAEEGANQTHASTEFSFGEFEKVYPTLPED